MISGLCLALLILAMAPLGLIEIPAMLDYPNHLARLEILSGAPSLAYSPRWRLYPNLAMDLAVPALARCMAPPVAAKVFLAFSQILLVAGAVFLEWTVKDRHRLGGLGALLVLFTTPFAWGELNFEFGLATALWALGLWIALRGRPAALRWLVHAAAVVILFAAHFAALGVYGLALGLIELARFRAWPRPAELARLGLFLASPLALIVALMLAAGGQVGQSAFAWRLGRKLSTLVMVFNPYQPLVGLGVLAAVVGLVGLMVVTRRLSLSRRGVWLAVGLLAAWVFLPQRAFGAWDADVRMITAAGAILPAFMEISAGLPSLAAIALVILANTAASSWTWLGYARDYRQLEASFRLLEPGAAVLVGRAEPTPAADLPLLQAPSLAAPAAGVFVSSLFTVPGEQPIAPRPAFASLDMAQGPERAPPPVSALVAIAHGAPAQANLARWPERYRYLYVIGPPGADPLPQRLTRLAVGHRFVLYRLLTASGGAGSG